VAMGSEARSPRGSRNIVLLKDQFLAAAASDHRGRRIARNSPSAGAALRDEDVYAAALIGWWRCRAGLPVPAQGSSRCRVHNHRIPSSSSPWRPATGPLYRGRLLRALAAFRGAGRPSRSAPRVARRASFWSTPSSAARSKPGAPPAPRRWWCSGCASSAARARAGARAHWIQTTCWRWWPPSVPSTRADPRRPAGPRLLRPDSDGRRQLFLALLRRRPGWAGERRLAPSRRSRAWRTGRRTR